MTTTLVADCPRCGAAQITFDVLKSIAGGILNNKSTAEVFCSCRNCKRSVVFLLSEQSIPGFASLLLFKGIENAGDSIRAAWKVERHISSRDKVPAPPPAHLPESIKTTFQEAGTCMAVGCYNAAGTMFRLVLDRATKDLLPNENIEGLNSKIRRSLGLRLTWLFNSSRLPSGLSELATSIKEDGNDGAHEGSLSKLDAEDLQDFVTALLERLYTEPIKLALAHERRKARRASTETPIEATVVVRNES
jgi:hypothetical protein